MAVTVHLSGHLKAHTNGVLEVSLNEELATIGEALESLWKVHPALRDRILNEQGAIRQHVNIFAGKGDVKKLKGLETVIDTDKIHIFNAVSGG